MTHKVITIGNEKFTLKKNKVNYPNFLKEKGKISLKYCYEKPSIYKQEIENHWREWFRDNYEKFGVDFKRIESYNTNFFTLGGVITHNGISYRFYITKTRQELYVIE